MFSDDFGGTAGKFVLKRLRHFAEHARDFEIIANRIAQLNGSLAHNRTAVGNEEFYLPRLAAGNGVNKYNVQPLDRPLGGDQSHRLC